MDNQILKLTLTNDSRIIPELSNFISDTALKLGLSKKKAYYLCFVLESAMELRTNEINEKNNEVTIELFDSGNYFKISLIDFGKPYILTDNQKMILKRKLVDKFFFEQKGRKGQKISFVYYYDHQDQIVDTKLDEVLLDEEVSYRQIDNSNEDILKAITCLYNAYDYEYYHQFLYSVDSFKKYICSGRYIPIIGENKHKQAVCYCALDENSWFAGVPELSNLVTVPFARGKGYASCVFKEAEIIAKKLHYEGINVCAVAHHPYTQKMCNKYGYVSTAIEYEINPKGTEGNKEDRRLDCVIGMKLFDSNRMHDLYISEECNELFKCIYDNLKVNYSIHNEQPTKKIEDSEITYVVDTDTSNCFVKIDECSYDIKDELISLLNNSEINECDVVTINLNISKENAIDGYNALRALGYICTGCLPGSTNGDYMLLQKFKVAPEYDKIVLEDNYQELALKVRELNNI